MNQSIFLFIQNRIPFLLTINVIWIIFLPFKSNSQSFNLASGAEAIAVAPSPNSISMINNINAGVNYYTGDFNMEIPIFNLKCGSINADIKLNYNSGGVKVAALPGWVGLGWSLETGGSITRVMHSLPDEFLGKIIDPRQGTLNAYGYLQNSIAEKCDLNNYLSLPSNNDRLKFLYFSNFSGKRGVNGVGTPECWDTEPDEFYFDCGKYKGKFVFGIDNKINIISDNVNLKIYPKSKDFIINGINVKKIYEFELITPEGVKYIYGSENLSYVEQSRDTIYGSVEHYRYQGIASNAFYVQLNKPVYHDSSPVSGLLLGDIPTTWHLREIVSPTNDRISYEYEQAGEISYLTDFSENYSFPNLKRDLSGEYFLSPVSDPRTDYYSSASFLYHKKIDNVKRLKRISTSDGNRIEFIAGSLYREDLPGDKFLDSIVVTNFNSNKINSFKLKYHYTTGIDELHSMNIDHTSIRDEPTAAIEILAERKRLILEKIYDYSFEGIPYEIYYDTQALPRRTSFRQDQWGYYNSNDRGTRLQSYNYTDRENGLQSQWIPYFWLPLTVANRTANIHTDETKVKASLLRSVRFPTGVEKSIEYEEKGISLGGTRVRSITTMGGGMDDSLKFSYGEAVPVNVPKRGYQIYNEYSYNTAATVSLSSSPINGPLLTSGSSVGYKTVTVTKSNGSQIKYVFSTAADFPNVSVKIYGEHSTNVSQYSTNISPYPSDIDMDFKRGLLKEEIYLNNVNDTVKKVHYNYEFNPANYQPVITRGVKAGIQSLSGNYPASIHIGNGAFYSYTSNWYFLKNKTIFNYDDNAVVDSVATVFSYHTTASPDKQLKKIDESKSDGSKILTYYYHSKDFESQNASIDTLIKRNMLSALIREDQIVLRGSDSTLASSKVQLYKNFAGVPLPEKSYSRSNSILSNNIPMLTLDSNVLLSYNYTLENALRYNTKFKIIQSTDKSLVKNAYIWGYKNTLPVAIVNNAAYGEVFYEGFEDTGEKGFAHTGDRYKNGDFFLTFSPPLGKSYKFSYWYFNYLNEWKFSGELNYTGPINITAGLAIDDVRVYPSDSYMNTYTYMPLIGVTSITDSKYDLSTYEYNNYSKLKNIKDKNGDIIKNYRYHIQGQGGQIDYPVDFFTPSIDIPRLHTYSRTSSNFGRVYFRALNGTISTFPTGTTFFWDFGDGSTSTDPTGFHTYEPGGYTVSLIISNSRYGTLTLSKNIKVYGVTVVTDNDEPWHKKFTCSEQTDGGRETWFTIEAEGFNLDTCVVSIHEYYCETFTNETCAPELAPAYFYYDVSPEMLGVNGGGSNGSYYVSNKFYFIIDTGEDYFYTDTFSTSSQTICDQ